MKSGIYICCFNRAIKKIDMELLVIENKSAFDMITQENITLLPNQNRFECIQRLPEPQGN